MDLAGSERNYETRQMTAQQHRDFAEINKSLMALKVRCGGWVLYGGLGMGGDGRLGMFKVDEFV